MSDRNKRATNTGRHISRRAQIQHVFSFLMLVILAGVVLLLGYKFISSLLQDQCDVERSEFKLTLEKYIASYASYGSLHRAELPAACNAMAICFIDSAAFKRDAAGAIIDDLTAPAFESPSEVLYGEVLRVATAEIRQPSSPPNNVFLLRDSKEIVPLGISSDRIVLEKKDELLCVEAQGGRFHIEFNGQGRKVKLTKPE